MVLVGFLDNFATLGDHLGMGRLGDQMDLFLSKSYLFRVDELVLMMMIALINRLEPNL